MSQAAIRVFNSTLIRAKTYKQFDNMGNAQAAVEFENP
jgi:hypothetical protein